MMCSGIQSKAGFPTYIPLHPDLLPKEGVVKGLDIWNPHLKILRHCARSAIIYLVEPEKILVYPAYTT